MSDKKSLKVFKPTGASIGYSRMPSDLVNALNESCDFIASDPNLSARSDFSHQLVGRMQQQFLIPIEVFKEWENWFKKAVKSYIYEHFISRYLPRQDEADNISKTEVKELSKQFEIKFESGWFNRYFKGNFNPVHQHSFCNLSSVGFLKVPQWSEEIKEDRKLNEPSAGRIEFISNGIGGLFDSANIKIVPHVGDYLLFPANLNHVVYPFKSEGERRSFSINISTLRGNQSPFY